MAEKKQNRIPAYKYIFGPVYSWRLGVSLGVDPVPGKEKSCPFDCVYCQLGKTRLSTCRRRVFVPTGSVLSEIASIPPLKIDYITFSGRGEPTLAKNLGHMIRGVKRLRKEKVAVITNGVLLGQKSVRADLGYADFVLVKLDAWDEESFRAINRPGRASLRRVLDGIREFRRQFKGKLAVQSMFIGTNKDQAGQLAALARSLCPDEVQLNTPLRKSPVKPLGRGDMAEIRRAFKGAAKMIKTVYDQGRKSVRPLNVAATAARHGKKIK